VKITLEQLASNNMLGNMGLLESLSTTQSLRKLPGQEDNGGNAKEPNNKRFALTPKVNVAEGKTVNFRLQSGPRGRNMNSDLLKKLPFLEYIAG